LADANDKAILLIDPVYTNYLMFAKRSGRKTFSLQMTLDVDVYFSFPSEDEIEKIIVEEKVSSVIVVLYDNPTGQLYDRETMLMIARLCVKHNLWFVSDEAYRELFYAGEKALSILQITDNDVHGIE